MPLSFIHSADFHLGADLRRFGPARQKMVEAQFAALQKTMQLAVEEQAAFVIICGDLFDRRNPPPSVLRKTFEIFSAYPDISVFIIPGTHDFLSEKGVYAAGKDDWATGNVTILNEAANMPYQVLGTDCFLYFRPNRSNQSSKSPIRGLKRQDPKGLHIGLAHGSLQVGGLDISIDYPINPVEIENSELDYLALGHWHKGRLQEFGPTIAAYPGISQPISWSDPEEGRLLVVRVDDMGKILVQPQKISEVRLRKIEATIYHPAEVSRLLEKAADPDTIVKLSLKYSDNFNDTYEVEQIIKRASSRFLLLQNDNQNADKLAASLKVPDNTNEQFIKAFLAELDRMKEADSKERAELYDRAAKMGTTIINGEQ